MLHKATDFFLQKHFLHRKCSIRNFQISRIFTPNYLPLLPSSYYDYFVTKGPFKYNFRYFSYRLVKTFSYVIIIERE